MKLSHRQLIIVSGLVWFSVGVFLLNVGLKLLLEPVFSGKQAGYEYFMETLGGVLGGKEQAALLTIVIGLAVGYFKGRYVLAKAAKRGISRILSLPNPSSILTLYSPKYFILLGCMVGVGILIKVLNVPTDLRGWIDVAIGAALLNGSMSYFQMAAQGKTINQ